MIITTPEKVMKEGEKLINYLKELVQKGINLKNRLLSDSDLKQKVDTFLKDLGKALERINEEIRYLVDMPKYNRKEAEELRTKEKILLNQRDALLVYVGK